MRDKRRGLNKRLNERLNNSRAAVNEQHRGCNEYAASDNWFSVDYKRSFCYNYFSPNVDDDDANDNDDASDDNDNDDASDDNDSDDYD